MTTLEVIKSFYDKLGQGDVAAVMALLNNDLEWTEAEGFPYYSGTWRTPDEVAKNLFVLLEHDWDVFSVQAKSFVSEGDEVVAFGNYGGVNRATGCIISVPFAHHWRAVGGRITRFVQYTDTLLFVRSMP
jgi:uncharacterized protein